MPAGRRLYDDMARTIKSYMDHEIKTDIELIQCLMMDLKKDNPNFDKDKFRKAAGIT